MLAKSGLALLALAGGIGLVALTAPAPAQARSNVSVGIGIGIPICCSGPYYDDYWGPPHHRGRYYGYGYGPPPPPVVYAPPPPPPVVYAPTPVYGAPPAVSYAPIYSPPYMTPSGQYCREYRTKATIDGKTQDMWGTACQQPDGTWR